MGKCFAKSQNGTYDKISLEDYIKFMRQSKVKRRDTIIAFQELSRLQTITPITRATIKHNLIKRSELVELILESCQTHREKIYSDYYRYYDSRKALAENSLFKDIIISQISLLNKNLKKFPSNFATKYQITQSVYLKSITHYLEKESVRKSLRDGMMSAFNECNKWGDGVEKEMIPDFIEDALDFWKENIEKVSDTQGLIMYKGKEGDLFMPRNKISELDMVLALDRFKFYSEENEEFRELREKYGKVMQSLAEKIGITCNCRGFGAIGLLELTELQ